MSSGPVSRPSLAPKAVLPPEHSLFRTLAEELHARPAVRVVAPAVVSCLALYEADPNDLFRRFGELARLFAEEAPPSGTAHALIELPGGRVKWERHGEFVSLVVMRVLPGVTLDRLDDFPSALDLLPPEWLSSLPGKVIAASDILVVENPKSGPDDLTDATRWFVVDALAASRVLDGVARVFTDFVLRPNGRTRVLVIDDGLGAAQTARLCQRMIEVEFYRMMGLLAFPLARSLFSELTRLEEQLASVTSSIATIVEGGDEAQVERERATLGALTRISAEVEQAAASTMFRFAAARAYFDIVRARVAELREQRIKDLRTLHGFLGRRLTPATDSVEAAARRLEALANRTEHATSLLRTRVDLAREEQNQRVLSAMDRRGRLQLRLQHTVEGLSVAAITYYIVSLAHRALEPFKESLSFFTPERLSACLIPFVAFAVWSILRRTRARATPTERE